MKQVSKDNIKAKVAYEWKKIYKNLAKDDEINSGCVSRAQFADACQKAGVNLTKEEQKKIGFLFSDGHENIDFIRMSKDLGLHLSSLDFFHDQK